jgi:hypothetical protein
MATVILKMSEEEFWKCTPRKLFAIWEVHKKVNGIKSEKEEMAYIDEISF